MNIWDREHRLLCGKNLLDNVDLWDRETQVVVWVVAAVLERAEQRDITQIAKEAMLLPGASDGISSSRCFWPCFW